MDLYNYWLFICASIVLCIVPGPDMMYLIGRSVAQGKKAGIAAALGINLGAYCHLLAAVLGISTIIATSAIAFTILKWCGAIYLVYIGIQALISKHKKDLETNDVKPASIRVIFWQGFISDVLNPKVAIFFISLLPQFIEIGTGNSMAQLLLLGVTVNVIAIVINILIVCFAHALTQKIRQSSSISALMHKLMGGLFIVLGFKLAGESGRNL